LVNDTGTREQPHSASIRISTLGFLPALRFGGRCALSSAVLQLLLIDLIFARDSQFR
jgi:hypothetical protein